MITPNDQARADGCEGIRLDQAAFWAKTVKESDAQGREVERPGISVRDHCLNVGCVAKALIELLPKPVRDLLPPGAAALAALHDIGKISPGFQQKCAAWRQCNKSWFTPDAGNEPSHALVSQVFLGSLQGGRLRRWAEALGSAKAFGLGLLVVAPVSGA
jgi:Cas3, HD domain